MVQGGRSLLSLKGNEERKPITSRSSSPYYTLLLFITLPLSLFFLVSSPLSSHLLSPCLIYSTGASHPFRVKCFSRVHGGAGSSLRVGTPLEVSLRFSLGSAPLSSHRRPGRGSRWEENGRKGGEIKTSRQTTGAAV